MFLGQTVSGGFCDSVVTTFIESGPGGWFTVHKYKWEGRPEGESFAIITDDEDDPGKPFTVDAALIRKGLETIVSAHLAPTEREEDGPVLHNTDTGKRLFMPVNMARRIIHAATAGPGDDGDFDAVDAMAIVEIGLFGSVVYA